MILSGGYATRYRMHEVRLRAKHAARALNEMMVETGATSVVVHGNSGVSCGFAALMLSHVDLNIVLLRKDNDNSHGAPIEGPEGHRLGSYLILDDLVVTGATMNRIRDKIATLHQKQHGQPAYTPECVGIVLYGLHECNSFKFADGHTVPARGR